MFFIIAVIVAAVSSQDVYNCTKITNQDECINAGYCYWSSNACSLDGCLKYVSDADYNAAEDTNTLCPVPSVSGSACKLYYLTGVPDCTKSGCKESSATDLYCRESNPAFVHNVIDKCFYDDLKNRAENPATTTPYTPNKNCKANNTNSVGWYVYTIDAEDCSLGGSQEVICNCLGTEWCSLHPACTLSSDSKSCVVDVCFSASIPTAPYCAPLTPATCEGVPRQSYGAGDTITITGLCRSNKTQTANKPNNDTNECFFAYYADEITNSNCADIRQCNTIVPHNACSKAKKTNDDGQTYKTPDEFCTLEPIPAGYFPSNFYCSDGRSLPSFGAASSVKISSMFVFLLAVIVLALL